MQKFVNYAYRFPDRFSKLLPVSMEKTKRKVPYGMRRGRHTGTEKNDARAIIFELVQGSGILIAPEGYWQKIDQFCRHHGILMFADEVLTGGGRTGFYDI